MAFGNASKGTDDYTPEEHLTAAVMEYKKLEAANQNSVEHMYNVLSSPFKIGSKPCEAIRGDALRCLSEIIGNFTAKSTSGTDGSTVMASSASIVSQELPPIHRCYESVLHYESCVLERTLSRHNSMVATFEARRLREADSAREAAAAGGDI
ncbi:hypothetical protein, conserved [Trypanosoma brucei gambiense DAL972]|uniref:Uncharacterized protein n=2 Tax=Trypanosoma brucei TaxID=5691 RepID=C9ZNI3_TRYB9|nr:hypothetical protein, conserved [Trypanosoma brucei gambiense DAL972]RHW72398.1 hypothetical protein DPX39_050012200 [Trypanosoma brucei equiperdum]CBH10961.1 hypothetical protein, conserved [Trypanosoma brucei gambiense DAL972]|eukprot:XP_011773248.1 hypothetical protein, conserved [Trypanosoma brucei gambiense DAL972]